MDATDVFPPSLMAPFLLVLHLAWVSVTTGSMMQYLAATEVERVVQLLWNDICIIARRFSSPGMSQPHGGDSSGRAGSL